MEDRESSGKKRMARQALGKGLKALIPGSDQGSLDVSSTGKRVVDIEVRSIKRNPRQPRLHVNDEKLSELSESIKQNGIIQPIIVRKLEDGYELIAGERRTLAAKKAGFDLVPAIIYNVSNQESLEFALIENVQRDDLNALELGSAFKMLMDEFQLTQDEVADKVGKDRATVSNYIRILGLNPKVKQLILDDKLSFGHARALLKLSDVDEQVMLSDLIIKEELSVRQCEDLIKKRTSGARRRKPARETAPKEDPGIEYHLRSLEEKMQHVLGTKVKIAKKKRGGTIEIDYYSLDELDRILELFDIDPYQE